MLNKTINFLENYEYLVCAVVSFMIILLLESTLVFEVLSFIITSAFVFIISAFALGFVRECLSQIRSKEK